MEWAPATNPSSISGDLPGRSAGKPEAEEGELSMGFGNAWVTPGSTPGKFGGSTLEDRRALATALAEALKRVAAGSNATSSEETEETPCSRSREGSSGSGLLGPENLGNESTETGSNSEAGHSDAAISRSHSLSLLPQDELEHAEKATRDVDIPQGEIARAVSLDSSLDHSRFHSSNKQQHGPEVGPLGVGLHLPTSANSLARQLSELATVLSTQPRGPEPGTHESKTSTGSLEDASKRPSATDTSEDPGGLVQSPEFLDLRPKSTEWGWNLEGGEEGTTSTDTEYDSNTDSEDQPVPSPPSYPTVDSRGSGKHGRVARPVVPPPASPKVHLGRPLLSIAVNQGKGAFASPLEMADDSIEFISAQSKAGQDVVLAAYTRPPTTRRLSEPLLLKEFQRSSEPNLELYNKHHTHQQQQQQRRKPAQLIFPTKSEQDVWASVHHERQHINLPSSWGAAATAPLRYSARATAANVLRDSDSKSWTAIVTVLALFLLWHVSIALRDLGSASVMDASGGVPLEDVTWSWPYLGVRGWRMIGMFALEYVTGLLAAALFKVDMLISLGWLWLLLLSYAPLLLVKCGSFLFPVPPSTAFFLDLSAVAAGVAMSVSVVLVVRVLHRSRKARVSCLACCQLLTNRSSLLEILKAERLATEIEAIAEENAVATPIARGRAHSLPTVDATCQVPRANVRYPQPARALPSWATASDTVYERFIAAATSNGYRRCLGWREWENNSTGGPYKWFTYSDVLSQATFLGSGLLRMGGAKRAERIGILSRNCKEWAITDLMCTCFSFQLVILHAPTIHHLHMLLAASGVSILVTERRWTKHVLHALSKNLCPDLRVIVQCEPVEYEEAVRPSLFSPFIVSFLSPFLCFAVALLWCVCQVSAAEQGMEIRDFSFMIAAGRSSPLPHMPPLPSGKP